MFRWTAVAGSWGWSSLLALLVVGCSSSGSGGGSGAHQPPPGFDDSHLELIRAEEGREAADVDGSGVTLAVVDTGIEADHGAFSDDSFDAAGSVGHEGAEAFTDPNGHGTHVASLAGGHGVGVAPRATLQDHALEETSPGSGTFTGASVASALDTLTHNPVAVANFSLTLSEGWLEDSGHPDFKTLTDQTDAVVVVSAGNDPAPGGLAAKADDARLDGQLLVAGGVNSKREAQFASACPDDDCASNDPIQRYISAPSGEESGADPEFIDGADADDPEGWTGMRGTSMAAPLVSGGAALVRERFTSLSAEEVVDLLLQTADDEFAGYDEEEHGAGILDLEAALTVTPSQAAASRVALTGNTRDDPPEAALAASASVARLTPLAGDALADAEPLERVLTIDELGRPLTLDLSGALVPAPGRDHAGNLARMSAPVRAVRHDRGVYFRSSGGVRTFGAQSAAGAGLSLSHFADSEPAATAAALDADIGPRAPLFSDGAGRERTLMGHEGGLLRAWRPALGGRVIAHGWHRRVASPFGAREPLDAVGGGAAFVASGERLAYRLAVRHEQRPEAWGFHGAGALAASNEDAAEQAVEAAVELRLGGSTALYADARAARLHLKATEGSLIEGVDGLATAAGGFGALYRGRALEAGVRLDWPERLERGTIHWRVPRARDRAGKVRYEEAASSLVPAGREWGVELHAAWDLSPGRVFTHVLRREEPGHRAAAPTEHWLVGGVETPF